MADIEDEYDSPTLNSVKKKYTELLLAQNSGLVTDPSKLAEYTRVLTDAGVTPSVSVYPVGSVIMSGVTGNGDSKVFNFGNAGANGSYIRSWPTLVRITTTVGGSPTCTFAIQGSKDGVSYSALSYSDAATPVTWGASTFAITSATTVVKVIQSGQAYRYLKVVRSANTNVTVSFSDVYPLGGNLSNVSVS